MLITQFDAKHWLEPGIIDVDTTHWLPYLTADDLGLNQPKLTLPLPDRGRQIAGRS